MNLKSQTVYLSLFFYIVLAIGLSACGNGGGSSTDGDSGFVGGDPIDAEPGSLLSSTFIANNQPLLREYSVDSYKIIYATLDTEGEVISASGLLSIPNKASGEKSPLVSYQHSTIFTDPKAPSNDSVSIQGISVLAGTGYIVSSPDYLGYAESTQLIHPFLHAESLASASIDMLRASKEFLADQNIEINDQLFLTGYSEGGYATIALQKTIQENLSSEFTTTASVAGAGPYDLTTTAQFFANQTSIESPSYMNFMIKAYDSVYELDQISEMYQAAYQEIINNSFDGSLSGSEVDNILPASPVDLFQTEFLAILQNFDDGTASHPLKDAVALNDIYDWVPLAPTNLYHGVADETVPYSNSQTAFDTMLANGATDVTLSDCPISGHVACSVPYVLEMLSFFAGYAEDL